MCKSPTLPTPEEVEAAKQAMWRERYEIQFALGVLITEDGRIVLPDHLTVDHRPKQEH